MGACALCGRCAKRWLFLRALTALRKLLAAFKTAQNGAGAAL
jgi:hypothetical protein